ncbi:MAG: transaldolase [Bacteroidetes bacterium]|nr:transaldolase [Bacteroidota bacterium]
MPVTKKVFSVIPDSPQDLVAGFKNELTTALAQLDTQHIRERIYEKDASLWKSDKASQAKIADRLGWLDLPQQADTRIENITAFATEVQKEGFRYAVLLGMGGSSLCSEVARETFVTRRGYLRLFVLDDTDPASIQALEKKIKLEKTLFIVASKSGTTKESLSFFHYFYDRVRPHAGRNAGGHFIAITDNGTPLAELGERYKFRRVFINPSDIGGRYSVLSDFGLIPMALMGVDIAAMMHSAAEMETLCRDSSAETNPGLDLGAEIGISQTMGRDKLTFVLSPSIAAFGYWVEQLIAESTGKEGKGIIPVNGETLGSPSVYGNDRIFIHISVAGDKDAVQMRKLNALESAGHPVIRVKIPDPIALGGEYYCWEVATAVAGLIIGINPFDEPNVAESKKNTENLLEEWKSAKKFKETTSPVTKAEDISIYTGGAATALNGAATSVADFIKSFLGEIKPGDYVAMLPYFHHTETRADMLQSWRMAIRDEYQVATTLLHGPRYLHSTGQLHKGGPDCGLYIILTADEKTSLPIPGEAYGFEVLHHAQAMGDFRSLSDKGRRVIRIHLGADVDYGLSELMKQIRQKRRTNGAR